MIYTFFYVSQNCEVTSGETDSLDEVSNLIGTWRNDPLLKVCGIYTDSFWYFYENRE